MAASRNDHSPELIKNVTKPLRPGSATPAATEGDPPVAGGGEPPRPRAKRKRGHRVLPFGSVSAPSSRERATNVGTPAEGATAAGTPAEGVTDAGTPAEGVTDAGTPAEGVTDVGTPAEDVTDAGAPAGGAATPEPPTPPRRSWRLPAALVLLSALLAALGAWFQTSAPRATHDRALVDAAATAEVDGQVRSAIERAFSYDFADAGAAERAAGEVLVGRAKCQHEVISGPVRELAPEQKLVVTVKAVTSGVTSLDGDRATVLLFLDQVTTRTTDNRSGGGVAMMRVGARKEGDRWLVDGLDLFGQDVAQSAELAKCANAG
ncbi:Mce-associated membrane protein [Actinosynnema pretiosum]|nr:Mce-associated membrane protein [Actinosynnema pretiosum]